MAASGPSEIILLSAGLIVAALVSGILLQTWDDMDDVLDERGKQGAEDVRTRVSLVSDPINIQWDISRYWISICNEVMCNGTKKIMPYIYMTRHR